ncbi:hypothetical protein AMAG_13510 [Allomyces macrogynus ATCC 38327]|uniref:Uncharacterized protein n=1 Tax=Allomyces macrogynus (strain ATCC 38327) TaxID=578462 RepID=A0A0L0T299_ALLM3|nr:hypothetical protein AMAG_13510 [Allomyces macrogynus ATCC 38327]|eukprot:KNE68871.1 hypothetical protein AMAG_13510 [Allomyces macrogynus ATCC 38327]
MSTVKRTCCGCMEIRRGVLFLLGLNLVVNLVVFVLYLLASVGVAKSVDGASAATDSINESVAAAGGDSELTTTQVKAIVYVLAAIFGVSFLWSLFGFVAAKKRWPRAFKVFTAITALFLIANIVLGVSSGSVRWTSLIWGVIQLYLIYAFWQYSKTMVAEANEQGGYSHA